SPRDIARDVLYYGYSTNRDPHSFPTRRSSDLNYRMTLQAAAHREASLLGLEGEAFANKVAEMLLNPPAHVADEATKMAAINTFTNPLGPTMQKWQSAISNSPARWVMPCVRTPTNIMKYTFARTPLAYASSAIRADIAAGGA